MQARCHLRKSPGRPKRFLAVFGILVLSVYGFGQGQVSFNNYDPTHGIEAIVTDPYGQPVSGTSARAALLGGPESSGVPASRLNPGNLTMLGSPVTGVTWVNFRTGAKAGYVDVGSDSTRILTDVGYNQQAMLQMVAWTGGYQDFVSAWQAWHSGNLSVEIGISVPGTAHTSLSALNTDLESETALAPFSLMFVPEPSAASLAGLGAGLWWLFRRWRKLRPGGRGSRGAADIPGVLTAPRDS